MPRRRRTETGGEIHQRPRVVDTSGVFLRLLYLLLLIGAMTAGYYLTK